jgi:hypothetical protein
MAVKVIISAPKTQEKPFPKLMTCNDGVVYYFVRKNYGLPIANWDENLYEPFTSLDADGWDEEQLTDYNGPITLQND